MHPLFHNRAVPFSSPLSLNPSQSNCSEGWRFWQKAHRWIKHVVSSHWAEPRCQKYFFVWTEMNALNTNENTQLCQTSWRKSGSIWNGSITPTCLCLDIPFLKYTNNYLAEPQAEHECSNPALLISHPLPVPQRAAWIVTLTCSCNYFRHGYMHVTVLWSRLASEGHHIRGGDTATVILLEGNTIV